MLLWGSLVVCVCVTESSTHPLPPFPLSNLIEDGLPTMRRHGSRYHVTRAAWSLDGRRIVATYNDELVYLFDAVDGVTSTRFKAWRAARDAGPVASEVESGEEGHPLLPANGAAQVCVYLVFWSLE